MSQLKNPAWWTKENDSAWERVKAAFKRDWDQTKHDMGGDGPETNQNVRNTVNQATGTETIPPRGQPTYEQAEPAYRFGYGAHSHYGKKYPSWNPELENELKRDWISSNRGKTEDWSVDAQFVRAGWEFDDED